MVTYTAYIYNMLYTENMYKIKFYTMKIIPRSVNKTLSCFLEDGVLKNIILLWGYTTIHLTNLLLYWWALRNFQSFTITNSAAINNPVTQVAPYMLNRILECIKILPREKQGKILPAEGTTQRSKSVKQELSSLILPEYKIYGGRIAVRHEEGKINWSLVTWT